MNDIIVNSDLAANSPIRNVLMLGLHNNNVLLPLLLVPNLTQSYIIDKFDEASTSHDGTWHCQKEDIKKILLAGSDENAYFRDYVLIINNTPIINLNSKCKLVDETEDIKKWTLNFIYEDVSRTLIFYKTNLYTISW